MPQVRKPLSASAGQFVFIELQRDDNTLLKPLAVKRTGELGFQAASNKLASEASTPVGS